MLNFDGTSRSFNHPPHRSARKRITLLAAVMVVATGWLTASPASAGTVMDKIDGISYTVNDADVSAGARVTGYDPSGLANPESVTIPNAVEINSVTYNVTEIGQYAFDDKDSESLILPDTVTMIGGHAFENNKLTSVDPG